MRQIDSKLETEALRYNLAILTGAGQVGLQFVAACKLSPVQAGMQYIEALIDPESLLLLEFLLPNPTRFYESSVCRKDGINVSLPISLSEKNPTGVLIRFSVDIFSGKIKYLAHRVNPNQGFNEHMNLLLEQYNSQIIAEKAA